MIKKPFGTDLWRSVDRGRLWLLVCSDLLCDQLVRGGNTLFGISSDSRRGKVQFELSTDLGRN